MPARTNPIQPCLSYESPHPNEPEIRENPIETRASTRRERRKCRMGMDALVGRRTRVALEGGVETWRRGMHLRTRAGGRRSRGRRGVGGGRLLPRQRSPERRRMEEGVSASACGSARGKMLGETPGGGRRKQGDRRREAGTDRGGSGRRRRPPVPAAAAAAVVTRESSLPPQREAQAEERGLYEGSGDMAGSREGPVEAGPFRMTIWEMRPSSSVATSGP